MRHDHALHTLLFRLAQDEEHLVRRRMTGGKDEIALRDHRDHLTNGGQQFAILRDRHERAILLRRPHLVLSIEGRHPHDAAPATRYGGHVLDSSRIDTADGQVQCNSAEHLDIRHHFANQKCQSGSGVVVVLEHDRAHFARLCQFGDFDRVDRSRSIIRITVHVDVDGAVEQSSAIDADGAPLTSGCSGTPQDRHQPNRERTTPDDHDASTLPVESATRRTLPQ
jgi:hypothetical protein